MSLPEIFISPTRKARDFRERRDDIGGAVYDALRLELRDALLNEPQRMVRTPGYGTKQATAADLFLDDYAGTGSDERLHLLVRVLADAAKGEDVQLRAMQIIDSLCMRHAEFHEGDALIEIEEGSL